MGKKNGTTAKERASVYKGTTENSAIQMLHFFFYFFFFIKGQKKTCYKMFFILSGILLATEGMKIDLFHLRSCMFRWMDVCSFVYN